MKRLLCISCLALAGACDVYVDPFVAAPVDELAPAARTGPVGDADGDGITNGDEGYDTFRDTDGDFEPDFLDLDSDDDGIPDADEAGDSLPITPPIDSDRDGLADYVDTDSDDNGLTDGYEGTGDLDGDRLPDYRDDDDDHDRVLDVDELAGVLMPPADIDADGFPNYRDPDSDDDFILDAHEWNIDTDNDALDDYEDLDSDNDGFLDSEEAGDTDIRTDPVDTDRDGIFDFRDLDSDNDGLGDRDEAMVGTDRLDADSDDDGASDLVEIAAGTNPLSATDNPDAVGTRVVVYQDDVAPGVLTVDFRTALQAVDLYFGFDATDSMTDELAAMRHGMQGIPALVEMLECAESSVVCAIDDDCSTGQVCNPGRRCAADPQSGCIPDIWTGIGTFAGIDSFVNLVPLQSDPSITAAAIPAATLPDGGEAPLQAPACVAEGSNCLNPTTACVPAISGSGCPGFRDDSVRIYLQLSDSGDQCIGARCGSFSADIVGRELLRQRVKFIGLYGQSDEGSAGDPARRVAESIGIASGATDRAGNPYVYRAIDVEVTHETMTAVRALASADNYRVTVDAADVPRDDGDALDFIERLEVNTTARGCTPAPAEDTEDTDLDGYDDAFRSIRPGDPVCWDVVPAAVPPVMAGATPRIFKARLTVRADGGVVARGLIVFVVAPTRENLPN